MPEPESILSIKPKQTDDNESTTTTTTTPRSVIIIPRSKSQASTCRRVTPTIVEKHLSNGDLYIGSYSNNFPHGSGKYLWKDGCMYLGSWKNGKPNGKGKLSWPSGATFEGEFRNGRMEGKGTFIGTDGDIYTGGWVNDRKQGYGVKNYANGDVYDGYWRENLQDGEGRYVWKNGNEYVGEWKNGVMNGRGVLVWRNGNRFDGEWVSGSINGNGVFTWSDGSCYVGVWSEDRTVSGTFYSGKGNAELGLPRICIWESDGEEGDITCEVIDNVEAERIYGDGFREFRRRNSRFLSGGEEGKRPGVTISKGHRHYELMLNLQLGIRYSVGKHASTVRALKQGDFDPKEKFWTRFPTEGSKITPPHQSAEFRWKDYCPIVFRRLRELFQVDPADYMLAICGNDALRELSSPGKSGSFFYLTQDDRFMIKTVKKSEVKVLIKMLPSYYKHVSRYENSLITKFFGVHCVKPVGGVKTRFIVMGNLFCSEYRIHRRFDLKGSSHGRTTDKLEGEIDETTTLKDLDLNYVFRLQTKWYQELIKQIDRDCEFLEAERIMDYSLLVGLHFRDESTGDKIGLSPFMLRTGNNDSYQNEKFMRGCRFLEAELQDMDRVLAGRKPLIRLGANMPARAEKIGRRSDFDQYASGRWSNFTSSCGSETYEVVLYFGIIDILQDYDISKKIEHAYKSLQVDSSSISAVDPKLYSKRFRDFIGRIFRKEVRKNVNDVKCEDH